MTELKSRPIVPREALAPWLAASLLVIGAYIAGVVVGTGTSDEPRMVLTVGLCSVLTAAVLVIYRSKRVVEDADRSQRDRPASEELEAWRSSETLVRLEAGMHLPPYAAGMLRYSGAVVELLEHAAAAGLHQEVDSEELISGRDDAAALHNLLRTMASEPVHLQKAAKVHTICALWEANQPRLEHAAAELDPEFHRRWRARHLAIVRLRHGERPRRANATLPYRDVTTPA
jgi:hypothetical protein